MSRATLIYFEPRDGRLKGHISDVVQEESESDPDVAGLDPGSFSLQFRRQEQFQAVFE